MRKCGELLAFYASSAVFALAAPDSAVIERGKAVYARTCLACHQPTGMGLPPVFPPLAGSEWIAKGASIPIRNILHGMQGPVTVKGMTYNSMMPPVGGLSDRDIADVVTYVSNSWGNKGPVVTEAEVKSIKLRYIDRATPWSAKELSEELAIKPGLPPVAEAFRPAVRPPAEIQKKPENKRGFGSGMVFTDKGHVFTNNHVIQKYSKYYIVTYVNGILKKKLPAILIKRDPQSDLAILQCSEWNAPDGSPKLPPPLVPSRQCKLGDSVFVLGFPLPGTVSSNVKYTNGSVSDMSGLKDDSREIQHTAQIQPGNSGGPMALTDGRIIGVVVSSLSESYALRASGALPQGVNFSVKSDYIIKLAVMAQIELPTAKTSSEPIEHVKAYTVQIMCEE